MDLSFPQRSARVRREVGRLCRQLAWAPLHEVALPNGRRADILALCPNGTFVCVEIKSGAVDFLSDSKWPDYRDFCDQLYFAVDADFPQGLLPLGVGIMVTADDDAAIVRLAPVHALPPARRRSLLERFARLGACRVQEMLDPMDPSALSCE